MQEHAPHTVRPRDYPQLLPGTRSPYDPAHWDPVSAAELQEARAWVSEVQSRNNNVHSSQPRGNNPIEQRQWQLALDAETMAGNLSPPAVRHFFIRQDGIGAQAPGWAGAQNPYRSFGPFINPGGGDVPRGSNTYRRVSRGLSRESCNFFLYAFDPRRRINDGVAFRIERDRSDRRPVAGMTSPAPWIGFASL